ncbi:MAG: hypothetical protein IAE78_19025 [Myxococcus sp.]|nr:hypothetical protein [Myxococcus sp.]
MDTDQREALTVPLPRGLTLSTTSADVGGALPALLFSGTTAATVRTVLLSATAEGPTFTVLPPFPRGASRDFLFFAAPTDQSLRVIPLPLSP